MLFSYKFKCTVSGVRGALLQAVLDCVTRLAAEVQGQSQGLLFEKLSMEETNALVPVPNPKAATHNHVQVRKMMQSYPSHLLVLGTLIFNKFQFTVSGVRGILPQAALGSVTRPAAGVQGHLQG